MSSITVTRVSPTHFALGSSYYSPALVEHAKAVPGMAYDPPTRTWRGYADAVWAVIARLNTKNIRVTGIEILPTDDSWRSAPSPFLFATAGLRDYQVEGVKFLIARSAEGALLGDSMRLGKSLMAATAARAFKQKTLIVCPSHIVGVWGRPKDAPEGPGEIAKWWPDAWKGAGDLTERGELARFDPTKPGVVCLETVKPFKETAEQHQARADELEHVNVIICHYDILYAWVPVLKLWGMATLILDEIHICAGWQSRRAAALKELSAIAKRRIGLTGTPVTNLPKNLHNVLEILAPGRFGYFFTGARPGCFAKTFCDAKQVTVGKGPEQKVVWDFTGRSNLDVPDGVNAVVPEETLHARLKFLMLRRLKKDVDPQLPSKQRQIIDVTVPATKGIAISREMFGTGSKALRDALDLAADVKIKSVVALVSDHVAEGEKVLCFCYRRLFAERVAKDVAKKNPDALVVFVHGGLTQKERDKRIQSVRKHDGPSVLACTIDTTSTGIDLSFASVSVFAELVFEPHELAQAEERTYSYGKNTKAFIQYVIARGTGDELILRAVISKLDTFEKVVGETGDHMKEELAARKGDSMKRLYEALVAMQAGAPEKKTRKRK